MPVLEAVLGLGLIVLIGTLGHRWLRNRQELKKMKMKIQAVRDAEEIAETLMLDEEMAGEVYKHLGEALRRDD